MQAVFHQVTGHGIAEAVEEVGADTDERQVNPGLVLEQVGKRLEGEFLGTNGFQTLLGQQTAGQRHDCGQEAKASTQHGILMCLGAAYHLLQIGEREQGDKAHGIGAYHAERRELVLLVVIIGHHAQQRAVRHVDGSVNGHHEQIERVGIDALAHGTEVGSVKQQCEDESQGDGTEDEPGTIGAPARLGAVGQTAHQGVGDHVKHARDEHQRCRVGNREAKDVGEKQRESN